MTPFEAIRLVAIREFRERGKSRVYLISSAVTLLIVVALVMVPAMLQSEGRTFSLGLVGSGNAPIVTAAKALTSGAEFPTEFEISRFESRAEAVAALEAGDVEAVLVDGKELVVESVSGFGGSELERLLQQAAGAQQLQDLLPAADAAAIIEILTGHALEVVPLRGEPAVESLRRGVIAYAGMLLMYIAVLTYGAWMLTGVIEEKASRVVEVLLAAVRPWQLLAGKMIGVGLLGLIQFVLTIIAAVVSIRVTGLFDLPDIPADLLGAMVVWFVLGYALYSSAYGATGSLISRMEEAQAAAFPLTLVAVAGFIVSFTVLGDPSSTLATVLTFIPPVAPFVVPIRIAFGTIPLWEHALAVVATLGFLVLMVRLAGRIYAGALLHYGRRLKLREAFRSAEL